MPRGDGRLSHDLTYRLAHRGPCTVSLDNVPLGGPRVATEQPKTVMCPACFDQGHPIGSPAGELVGEQPPMIVGKRVALPVGHN